MNDLERRIMLLPKAFSLVEVTLALGIVAFGLVAILGVLPVALTAGRTSIAQTRAASIAETIFAGLRAQPFTRAVPGAGLDVEGGTALPELKLEFLGAGKNPADSDMSDEQVIYAVLVEALSPSNGSGSNDPTHLRDDPRQLRVMADSVGMNNWLKAASDAGIAATGYMLTLRFNNHLDQPPSLNRGDAPGATPRGRANRVSLSIRGINGTATAPGVETFNFITVIANRRGN